MTIQDRSLRSRLPRGERHRAAAASRRRRWRQTLIALFCTLPAAAGAQPIALDVADRVNGITRGDQDSPAVTSDAAGDFVVVWSCCGETLRSGVFARRYDGSGVPLTEEFPVTADTGQADVASDAAGNFIVAWDNAPDDDQSGISAQRYDQSATALGAPFRVNTTTQGVQVDVSVACDDAGDCVAVWDTISGGVFGQRFDSSGAPAGDEFVIDDDPSVQHFPAVASDRQGNWLVVWNRFAGNPADSAVYGQRFNASGAAVGDVFAVAITGNEHGTDPSSLGVAADNAGSFTVVWNSPEHGDPGFPTRPIPPDVYAQRYDGNGNARGELMVTAEPERRQHHPAVAALPDGGFVVVWENDATLAGTGVDAVDNIVGQQVSASGAPVGPQFIVNSALTSDHRQPDVASDRHGNFVVVWYASDGDGRGVFERRYAAAGFFTPSPTPTNTGPPPETPTATATPRPTNTAVQTLAPMSSGGGGCAANSSSGEPLAGAAAVLLALVVRRRRTSD